MLNKQFNLLNESYSDFITKNAEIGKKTYQSAKNMYFSLSPKNKDLTAIKIARPKHLLVSYATWRESDIEYKIIDRNQHWTNYNGRKLIDGEYCLSNIIEEFWADGYRPTIILDSGAYSFKDSPDESIMSYLYELIRYSYFERYINMAEDIHAAKDSFEEEGLEYIEIDGCIEDIEISEEYIIKFLKRIISGDIPEYIYDISSEWEDDEMIDEIDCGDLYCSKNSQYKNFIDYIRFIGKYSKYVDYIVSLDDLSNPQISKENWDLLRTLIPNTIPTFHFKEDISERNDTSMLEHYIKNGATYIGLGGTVPYRMDNNNSNKCLKEVADWVNSIVIRYPDIKFHVFGTQSDRLLRMLLPVYSADGTCWIISAAKKYAKLGKLKEELASYQILKREVFDDEEEYFTMKNRIDDAFGYNVGIC